MNALQRAVPLPQVEIVVDRALRRPVLRHRLPLTAGREHIKNTIQHFAHITPCAGARRAWLAGSAAQSASIPPRSDRSITQALAARRQMVFLRPHVAPHRKLAPHIGHNRLLRFNNFSERFQHTAARVRMRYWSTSTLSIGRENRLPETSCTAGLGRILSVRASPKPKHWKLIYHGVILMRGKRAWSEVSRRRLASSGERPPSRNRERSPARGVAGQSAATFRDGACHTR
jgi:hypothetical protein